MVFIIYGGIMNISQFSEMTSLSAYTLRYYEKLGLLTNISRNSSGHRSYSRDDLTWVAFITRLKETGMPLEQILEYARLRAQGESTYEQRRILLRQHRDALKTRIDRELEHLRMLDLKIDFYQENKPLT
jgi:DNA-binding transcriptional MerR regulator